MNSTAKEDQVQQALFVWAAWASATDERYLSLDTMFAIPNGGKRSKATAALLKRTGVKAGVPDILLPVARGGYHGLFIELKREKGGHVSPAQESFMEKLMAQGYKCEVCRGFDSAVACIQEYMTGGEKHGT